jgi:hypothetical protein
MVDPNLLVRQYLLQNSALLAMLGSYQVVGHLPEKFDPANGPIVVVNTEGGESHPEIPIQTQRVKVRVWAGVNGFAVAREVYGVVHDWLHGQNDLDFGDLGTILASIETVTGQDITDPDTGWATVLAYYDVTVRDGAFTDLSGTFQQGSQTKAYIDAQDAAVLAEAEAYTDAHSGGTGNDRPYIDAGDAASLASANAHSDAADAVTLNSANSHSDSADATTLAAAEAYADAGDATTLATAEAYTDAHSGGGVSLSVANTWTKPQTFQPDTDVPGAIFKASNVTTPAADLIQFQDKTGAVQSRVKADGSFQAGSNPATINVGATGAPAGLGNPGSIYTRDDGADGTTLYVAEASGSWFGLGHSLAVLSDVLLSSPADADVLTFEASSGNWINAVTAKSKVAITSNWLRSYDASTGLFTAAQPAFSDLSGTIAATQLIAPTASTFGGIKSLAAVATTFLTSIGTDGIPVAAQPNFSDLAGSFRWDQVASATGALTLNNAGNATSFNQTSAVAWVWANTTAATSGTSQSSPILTISGQYWTSAVSAEDKWTLQNVVANGTNGASTLTFTHSGSSGAASIQVPSLTIMGTTSGSNVLSAIGNGTNLNTTALGFKFAAAGTVSTGSGDLNLGGVNDVLINVGSGRFVQIGSAKLKAKDTGLFTTYANIATVSGGVPAEYATVDLITQGAAIAATTLYAVPAAGAGMYRISWVATVTRAGSVSSTLGGANGFQAIYTDADDSVAKTSPPSATSNANTTATQLSGSVIVYAKASTNIQYKMGYTDGGGTVMQYNLHIKCEAL